MIKLDSIIKWINNNLNNLLYAKQLAIVLLTMVTCRAEIINTINGYKINTFNDITIPLIHFLLITYLLLLLYSVMKLKWESRGNLVKYYTFPSLVYFLITIPVITMVSSSSSIIFDFKADDVINLRINILFILVHLFIAKSLFDFLKPIIKIEEDTQ